MLKFVMENGWIAVRPSGTEPKIKFYFGITSDTKENSEKMLADISKKIMDFANKI